MGTPAARLGSGEVIAGQYRLEGVLGEGGMGAVYSVTEIASGKPLAMKVVVDNRDEEHVTRFLREARSTMRIQSDHVVRVFDVGSIDGKPYMVMERLDGRTLKQLAEKQKLDERTVADLMIQACEGLSHAHSIGIVHRDVKPSNLFVLDGPDKHLKLLDFGISRSTMSLEDWERTATVTETHALLGSPHYVSPEQLQNPSGVDERADLWSLGVSMYYALNGRLPFEGGSLAELLVAVMSKPPAPMRNVSPEMSAVVARCLDRTLDRRFRRAGELAQSLLPFASPRWAGLVPRIRMSSMVAPKPSAPPPASRAPGDNTLTVDHPIDIPPTPPAFELTGTETLKMSSPPEVISSPALPILEPLPVPVPVAVPAPKRRGPLLPLAFVGLIVLTIVFIGYLKFRPKPPAPIATVVTATEPPPSATPEPSVSTPPPPSSSSPPPAVTNGPPTFTLIADAPIAQVTKPAQRRKVVVEDGQATLTVNPFKGDLQIEVDLVGGGKAKGLAKANGPTQIHLTSVTKKGQPKPPAASSKPVTPTPTTTTSSELHNSPYQ